VIRLKRPGFELGRDDLFALLANTAWQREGDGLISAVLGDGAEGLAGSVDALKARTDLLRATATRTVRLRSLQADGTRDTIEVGLGRG
jgi:hypothetical protein